MIEETKGNGVEESKRPKRDSGTRFSTSDFFMNMCPPVSFNSL